MKNYNILYKDIVINFDLINTCKKEFIPANILSQMLQCNNNNQEKKGYTTYLKINNFENNLYYTVNNTGISDSSILNGCLYTNIDSTWEHLTIKLISAIYNYRKNNNNQDVNTPILTYKNSDCIIFFKWWG